jgi:hypothetical protein
VQRAGAANWAADLRAIERFVYDLADRARATAALGAATEAAIDMTRGPTRGGIRSGSHLVVTQYIAGADDHQIPSPDIR